MLSKKKEMYSLGEEIQFILLQDTPDALSIGRLCVEHGFDFVWRGSKKMAPYLSHPDGRRITFEVEDYVPYHIMVLHHF